MGYYTIIYAGISRASTLIIMMGQTFVLRDLLTIRSFIPHSNLWHFSMLSKIISAD